MCTTARVIDSSTSNSSGQAPAGSAPRIDRRSDSAELRNDVDGRDFRQRNSLSTAASASPASGAAAAAAATTEWACATCSLLNLSAAQQCRLCDQPRVPPQPNKRSTSAARKQTAAAAASHSASGSGAAAVAAAAAPALKPGEWQCQVCTFHNTSGAGLPDATCEVCGTAVASVHSDTTSLPGAAAGSAASSSSSGGAAAAATASSWQCHVCRAINMAEAMRCRDCQFFSPGVTQNTLHEVARYPQPVASYSAAAVPATAASHTSSNGLPSGPLDSGDADAAAMLSAILSVHSAKDKFADPGFMPGEKSLKGAGLGGAAASSAAGGSGEWAQQDGRQWSSFSWRQARDVTKEVTRSYAAPWTLLPVDPRTGRALVRPQDIRQGQLGNCWFISALSVLSERPHLLQHLLVTKELNPVGVYQVRFCKSGRWTVVTVDDWLPVDRHTGRLAFAHSPINQLWLPLVEKAYARLHGCYAAIASGHICDAFTELTGAPSEHLPLHAEDRSSFHTAQMERLAGSADPRMQQRFLWVMIESFRDSKFLMGASCGRRAVPTEEYRALGLLPNHAYALLDVKNVQGLKLIKLRNPWGSSDNGNSSAEGGVEVAWKGDYNASSPLWTPALRAAVGYNSSGSGDAHDSSVFFMTFADFLRYFNAVDVCKYQDDWHVMRLADQFPLPNKSSSRPATAAASVSSPPQRIGAPSFSFREMASSLASPSSPAPQYLPWGSEFMYELQVAHTTCAFISLVQQDLRGTNAPKPHHYKNMGLFLLKCTDPSRVRAAESSGRPLPLSAYHRCAEVWPDAVKMATMDVMLSANTKETGGGHYLIMPASFAENVASHGGAAAAVSPSSALGSTPSSPAPGAFPFVLCLYSAYPLVVRRRSLFGPALTLGLQLSVLSCSSAEASCKNLDGAAGLAQLYTYSSQGGSYLLVVNRHPSKYLSISVDCTGSEGVVCSRPPMVTASGQPRRMQTQDIVPPRHRQLLLVLLAAQGHQGYSYRRSCESVFVHCVSRQPHNPPLQPGGNDIHQPISLDAP